MRGVRGMRGVRRVRRMRRVRRVQRTGPHLRHLAQVLVDVIDRLSLQLETKHIVHEYHRHQQVERYREVVHSLHQKPGVSCNKNIHLQSRLLHLLDGS